MRKWTAVRTAPRGPHPAHWRIESPDHVFIFVPEWSDEDAARAQFIVDACNEKEAREAREPGWIYAWGKAVKGGGSMDLRDDEIAFLGPDTPSQ